MTVQLLHLCFTAFLSYVHCTSSAPLPDERTIDISAVVGEPAVLPCYTQLAVGVVWMFQRSQYVHPKELVSGGVVVNGNKEWYELDTVMNGDYNLVIKSVKLSDAGLYTCDEDDGVGQRHYIRVVVLDRHPETVDVDTGQTVILHCHLRSLGTTPSWYYRTSPTADRQDVSVGGKTVGIFSERFSVNMNIPGQHNLVIMSAHLTDTGIYICATGSLQQLAERRLRVTNKSHSPVSTVTVVHSTSSRVVLPCRPSSDGSVQWTYQKTSDDETIELSVSGSIVNGYKDRFELEHSYNLVIKFATSSDDGRYRCTENNGLGVKQHEVNFISEDRVASSRQPAVIGAILLSVLCCILIVVIILLTWKLYTRRTSQRIARNDLDDDEPLLSSEQKHELEREIISYREKTTAACIDNASHNLCMDTFIYELTKHQPIFDRCTKLMAHHIRKEWGRKVKAIIGVRGYDSRGDLVASRIAGKLNLAFVDMFDSRRSTGSTNNETEKLIFKSKLQDDDEDYTMEIVKNPWPTGEKVVIVDNAVSTGAAMKAAYDLATCIGLDVVECVCLVKAKTAPVDGLKCKFWSLFEN